MQTLKELFGNYVLMVPVLSWMAAQIIKFLIAFITTREFIPERLFGAGGMPSSHSAMVTSLVIATGKAAGPGSVAFAVAVVLACVVIYDAMGVRRAAGEQAKAINRVMNHLDIDEDEQGKELKEVLGHTPFEVLGGVLLGIIMPMAIM